MGSNIHNYIDIQIIFLEIPGFKIFIHSTRRILGFTGDIIFGIKIYANEQFNDMRDVTEYMGFRMKSGHCT